MGINILYEDASLVVCEKPVGVLSETEMPTLLREKCGIAEIFVLHRLDRGVGGVMVFAKTKKAAASLSAMIQAGRFKKEYLALVEGEVAPESGEMRDLLFHDRTKNKTYVVKRERKGVKEALLDYKVVKTQKYDGDTASLVKIRLHTGRTHQIRVQFASRHHPLLGDSRYGSKIKGDIALFSYKVAFPHPDTGEEMEFSLPAPALGIWARFV